MLPLDGQEIQIQIKFSGACILCCARTLRLNNSLHAATALTSAVSCHLQLPPPITKHNPANVPSRLLPCIPPIFRRELISCVIQAQCFQTTCRKMYLYKQNDRPNIHSEISYHAEVQIEVQIPLLAMYQPALLYQFYLVFCPMVSNTFPSTSITSTIPSLKQFICVHAYIFKIYTSNGNRYRKFPLMDNVCAL